MYNLVQASAGPSDVSDFLPLWRSQVKMASTNVGMVALFV
jgi:hypothetical protein